MTSEVAYMGPLRSARTMTAARLRRAGDITHATEPVPAVGEGEELVRVTAVGLCGSDLHWFSEGGIGDATLSRPVVPGHEFAGVIEGGPRHGMRVAVDPALPCRHCPTCQAGHRNLCPAVIFAGHGDCDGGLREYLSWPAWALHPLPDEIDDAGGALLEPLGVALHALDLGHVRIGASVAIVGAGPIGLLLLQAVRRSGAARVVVVEPLAHRRRAAQDSGADEVVAPTDAEALLEVSRGGADVVFEMAGNDDAVATAICAARPGARVVLGGIPDDDRTTFPAGNARRKGLTLVLVRRMNEAYPRSTTLATNGSIDLSHLVTHRFPLTAVAEAFTSAQARVGLKVIIDVSRS